MRPGRFWHSLRFCMLRPASAGPDADLETCTKPGLNLCTWPAPLPARSGVCTAGRKRVSLSQLCGGRARADTVRLPAAFSDGGACGVAAVCRRPVKDPPRQFGERAFTGFPWVPAVSSSLRHLYWSRSKTVRRVALHLFLPIPRRSVEQAIIARSYRYPLPILGP